MPPWMLEASAGLIRPAVTKVIHDRVFRVGIYTNAMSNACGWVIDRIQRNIAKIHILDALCVAQQRLLGRLDKLRVGRNLFRHRIPGSRHCLVGSINQESGYAGTEKEQR
jgi:hypothetical protein